MEYIIYYFKSDRHGYEHTEQLCFPCATKQANHLEKGETIHPVIVTNFEQHTKCPCGTTLNWLDS